MRAPYTQLYLHLIWSTWDRLPLITELIEPHLYSAVAVKCRELNCEPYAIGGIADHLHLLVRVHPAISVAMLVKEVKGASSHLITHQITPEDFFKWQGAYRAFTIRKSDVSPVKSYIENQKKHHAENQLQAEYEPNDNEKDDDSK